MHGSSHTHARTRTCTHTHKHTHTGGLLKGILTERGLEKKRMPNGRKLENMLIHQTTSMPFGNFLLFLPTKGAFTVFFRCLQNNY